MVNPAGLAYDHKMKNAISYLKNLALMLRARKSGDEDLEERPLDSLDDAWLRLSKREAELIDRVSFYMARDLLSLHDLKVLIARLESESRGSVVAVRIYKARGKTSRVRRTVQTSVFRLPGFDAVRLDSAKQARKFVNAP
ncbi:MAG: hypothetical protein ACK5N0_15695 [Synechococcaceae cyanobacterium]